MAELAQRRTRIVIVIAACLGALALMYHLRPVLNPFLLALALAYILNPLVQALKKRGVPRRASIAGMFIVMTLVFGVAVLVLVPKISSQASSWMVEVTGENFTDNNNNGFYDPQAEYDLYTDLNHDGQYNKAEPLTDNNKNGRYDSQAEKDTWQDTNKNKTFDPGEPYTDLNDNKKYDPDIPADTYADVNQNGKYDAGEPFVDLNGNGVLDDTDADEFDFETDDINHNFQWDQGMIHKIASRLRDNKTGENSPRRLISIFVPEAQVDAVIQDAVAVAKRNLSTIFSQTGSLIASTFQGGLRGAAWLFEVGMLLLLTPVYLAFLLYSLNDIWTLSVAHIPGRARPRTVAILKQIDLVIGAFFRGRLLVCAAIGLFTALGFFFCGVRFGLLFGCLIGVLSLIPFLNVLGLIPALISCYAAGFTPGGYAAVLAIYAVGQGLDPLITSVVLGKDLQLHPLTILLSLFICAQLFGFFGMLLAVPIVATAKILGREFLLPHITALAQEKGDIEAAAVNVVRDAP